MAGALAETIDTLEAQVIRHVSCGDSHSVAVTDAGQVFVWGNNRQGQLGTGLIDVTQSKTPKLVTTSFLSLNVYTC